MLGTHLAKHGRQVWKPALVFRFSNVGLFVFWPGLETYNRDGLLNDLNTDMFVPLRTPVVRTHRLGAIVTSSKLKICEIYQFYMRFLNKAHTRQCNL